MLRGAKNGAGIEKLFCLAIHQALAVSDLGAVSGLCSELTVDLFCMNFFSSLLKNLLHPLATMLTGWLLCEQNSFFSLLEVYLSENINGCLLWTVTFVTPKLKMKI